MLNHIFGTLARNVISLSSVQAANYIVPLIMVPYLLRTIGTEKYGLFAFASAFTAYFPALIDYGFNLTGTRDISQNRRDKKTLSAIVSSIISAKLILFLIAGIIFFFLVTFIPRFTSIAQVLIWSFVGAVGASFTPIWYFQGTEKMAPLALLSLVSKALFLSGVFIFVRQPDDYLFVFYCSAVTAWIPSLSCLVYLFIHLNIRVSFASAFPTIKSGFSIFTTQFCSVLLANSNIFILGLFSSNTTVAIYAIAEKIVRAVIYCGSPISSAVFPRSGYLFKQSTAAALSFLRKVFLLGGIGMGTASVLLFIFASELTSIVAGNTSPETSALIRLMAILPLSIFIDNIYGTQVLLNLGKEKLLSIIIVACSLLTLVLLVCLIPLIGAWGAATAYLCSEVCILVWMTISLRRQGISIGLRERHAHPSTTISV